MKKLGKYPFEKKREVQDYLYLKDNYTKLVIYYIICVISFLFVYVLVISVQDLKKYIYDQVDSIDKADYLFLVIDNGNREVVKITRTKVKIIPRNPPVEFLIVNYSNKKYYYSKNKQCFRVLGNRFANTITKKPDLLISLLEPLDENEYNNLKTFYGENKFSLSKKPLFKQFLDYITQPRYLVNMCAAVYFITYEPQYGYFAKIFLQLFLMFSIKRYEYTSEVESVNKTCNNIGNSVVYRKINGRVQKLTVNSSELTIGDIVEINNGDFISFDCVIFAGTCVVDQSTLTGETIPVLKRSVIEGHHIKIHNTILAGSNCIQKKSKKVFAIVTAIGFDSFQGNLISGVTGKKFMPFKFYEDLTKLFSVFLVILLIFLVYIVIIDIRNDKFSFDRTLFMFVLLTLQSFPLSIYVSLFMAERVVAAKMQKYNLKKASTDYVVKSGRMNLVCFDKTGTLTEGTMKLKGFILIENNDLGNIKYVLDTTSAINQQRIMELMACCNSLDIINGKISGDFIEKEIHNFTHFSFKSHIINEEIEDEALYNQPEYFKQKQDIKETLSFTIMPSENFREKFAINKNHSYDIKRYFHFDSTRRRMSIVVNNPNGNSKYLVLMKGAPEVIPNHCTEESMPSNYEIITENYSKRGYRLLAMCYKEVDEFTGDANELEDKMTFLGLLVFVNPLKQGVRQVIKELRINDIQSIMITGDALNTAINVGYSSEIIENDKWVWIGQLDLGKNTMKWYKTNQTNVYSNKMIRNIVETETVFKDSRQSSKSSEDDDILMQDIASKLHDCKANNFVLAFDGDTIEYLVDNYVDETIFLEQLFKHTLIYGRTNPHQKKLIVKYLKHLRNLNDFTVGFVGDGANDAEALHEADVGLSLGNQLSSMVASYYTEEDKIEKIKTISIEGKFALTFSIEILAFSTYVNLTNNLTILFMGLFRLNYTSYEFFTKLACFFPLYIILALTSSSDKMTYHYPEPSFLRKSIFIPFLISTVCAIILTADIYFLIVSDPTFKDISQVINETRKVYINDHNFFQNKLLAAYWFFRSCFLIWAVSISVPFKKSLWTNTIAVTYSLVLIFYNATKFFDNFIDFYWYQIYLVRIVRWPNMYFSTALKYFLLCVVSGFFTIGVYQVGIKYYLLKKMKSKQKEVERQDELHMIYNNKVKN